MKSPCEDCTVMLCPIPCVTEQRYRNQQSQKRELVNSTIGLKYRRRVYFSPDIGYTENQMAQMEDIITEVIAELQRADAKHEPMDGIDEGYGTLRVEVAELKREISRRKKSDEETWKEAVQVAAMGLKLLRDCFTEKREVIR